MSVKHLYLKGLLKAFLVKFETAADIINSISAGRGQYLDYLQTRYNYIQVLLKTSIIIQGIVAKILFRHQAKLSNSTN